ncbi:hypothetical protein Bca4012_058671 [Brassica carinata]
MSRVPYAIAVGSLMYAMVCTIPDLAHVVSVVSRFMVHLRKEHSIAVKRIFRYLKGTYDVDLVYGDKDQRLDRTTLQSNVTLSTTEAEYMTSTEAAKKAI